ncbi:hypothetical protein M409DRAFT_65268 [Zasmidium cellare ATCC 36951]|uniref:FAD/NAD(P)-binding domain-containing protein n=1 Tax=Zasmidium cellare ATCC 36951 TaxID=1080233 RepID=A0A6A6CPD2_ZASCE|nr:uncharacterized protein M409DRAFT_65268 [Zasmidium cellare ATCC 36951]KAF2168921.1 hypothetical protein M409DRAFT_65268 [Zasmidium cellare ATCC 36951]
MTTFDIIIIGAGISGLAAAHQIQTSLPHLSYTILEARNAIGGTWDLFRFPGVRSDTDLVTFGFSWYPWTANEIIAKGELIRDYLQEAAASEGIDRRVKFGHKVRKAEWDGGKGRWRLSVGVEDEKTVYLEARAIVFAAGYYDYDSGLAVDIPGLKNFDGDIIHPQFWPKDLDLSGKSIALIGSGATAITLLPSLAKEAEHVTMVQRSPTYILSLPNAITGKWLYKFLPGWLAFQIQRIPYLLGPMYLFLYCKLFPKTARRRIRDAAAAQLPKDYPVDKHFQPRYEPWDQRICFSPDGDFYQAIRDGKASIVTDTIQEVGSKGITMSRGDQLDCDMIVTATGLKMRIAGGIEVVVDGEPVVLSRKALWRSTLLQDVPNCAFLLGYKHMSWTIGAEINASLFCRVLRYMEGRDLRTVVPRQTGLSELIPFLSLKSSYVLKGMDDMLKTGSSGPWKGRETYFVDRLKAQYLNITNGLDFS